MQKRIIAIGILLLLATVTLVLGQTGNDLFQQGLAKERAEGDLLGAIQVYERILKEFPSNRSLVARTLVRLGVCHEKLGQAKGREYLQRVIDSYTDQPNTVAEARALLSPASKKPITVTTPNTRDAFSFAISPDGRQLVFQGLIDGRNGLWLQPLEGDKATLIIGTENAGGLASPFWSPDGRSIGFFAEQKLKRVDITGNNLKVLAPAPLPRGGAWSPTGVIVYAPYDTGPLYRVPADGGQPTEATLNLPDSIDQHPQFLPDGHHFLFHARRVGLSIGSIDNLEVQRFPITQRAVFAAPDHLLFVSRGALYAQRFDTRTLESVGDAIRLADRVAEEGARVEIALSASAVGTVVYRAEVGAARQLAWYDRSGREIVKLGLPDRAGGGGAGGAGRLSPDGRSVLLGRQLDGAPAVYEMDLTSGTMQLVEASRSVNPIWSPTGDEVAFSLAAGYGAFNLYKKPRGNYSGAPELLLDTREIKYTNDWSREGFLLYARLSPETSWDLLALPPGGGEPIPIVQTTAQETDGRFSSNGKWILYVSNEIQGETEVFVQPFPGSPNSRKQISMGGARLAQWGRGDREIYFMSPDNRVMVAQVGYSQDDQSIEIGKPAPLFSARLRPGSGFSASSDGERFLVSTPLEDAPPILVLSNWDRQTR